MTAPADLRKLGDKPSLGNYLRDIWKRRDFAVEIATGEIRSQHMHTVLGHFWHILNPLLQLSVYALVFGVILRVSREGVDNLIPFLAVGVFLFHYSQRAVTAGAKSIASNEGLIRSIQFPRLVLPLSTVLAQTFALLPALGLMMVIALVYGEPLRPSWVILPLVVGGLVLFSLGLALVAARLTDAFPDFGNILPFLFRLGFYMSGVIYSVEARADETHLKDYIWLFDLNPFYAYISLGRVPILGDDFHIEWVISAALWTVAMLIFGLLYFRAGEQRYGRG